MVCATEVNNKQFTALVRILDLQELQKFLLMSRLLAVKPLCWAGGVV
jgi:hypothetical protein